MTSSAIPSSIVVARGANTAAASPRPHHRIDSLEIPAGYLGGTHLQLADGLNCIIGPRGSGKTTLLQILLFALGAPIPADREAAHLAVVTEALAGGSATAQVTTQHGKGYSSSRTPGTAPIVCSADGEVLQTVLHGELFKSEAYSQNEIESIALHPRAQLPLFDKMIEPEVRRIEHAIADRLRRLTHNAASITALQREIEGDQDLVTELPGVGETLRALHDATGPDAAEAKHAFDLKALRTRENAALLHVALQLRTVRASLDAFAGSSRRALGGALDADLDLGPNGRVIATVRADLQTFGATIEDCAARMRAAHLAAEATLGEGLRALAALHLKQNEAYDSHVAKHAEGRARAAERDRMQQRFVELSAAAKRVTERTHDLATLRADRGTLVRDLHALRHERFLLRKEVAKDLTERLSGDVRVSISEGEDRLDYHALLTEILQGANIRPASYVKQIAHNIAPEVLLVAIETNNVDALAKVDVRADDPKNPRLVDEPKRPANEARARRVLDLLQNSGRISDLETVELGDVPLIELRAGKRYKPSTKVSVGQRCTCILPILLLDDAGPLIIDQPEDSLDNGFIAAVLLKSIMIAKRTRQILFVTHNANVIVLPDAERVFVLDSDGDTSSILESGPVDETRGSIERLTEGGREAFLLRSERYGHGR